MPAPQDVAPLEGALLTAALLFFGIVPSVCILVCICRLPKDRQKRFFLSQVRIMISCDLARDVTLFVTHLLFHCFCLEGLSTENGSYQLVYYYVRVYPTIYTVLESVSQVPDIFIAVGLAASVSRRPRFIALVKRLQGLQRPWFIVLALMVAAAEISQNDTRLVQVDGCWKANFNTDADKLTAAKLPSMVLLVLTVMCCAGCYLYVCCKSFQSSSESVAMRSLHNTSRYLLVGATKNIFLLFLLSGHYNIFSNMRLFAFWITGLSLWSTLGDAIVYAFQSRHIRQQSNTINPKAPATGSAEELKSRDGRGPMSLTVAFGPSEEIPIENIYPTDSWMGQQYEQAILVADDVLEKFFFDARQSGSLVSSSSFRDEVIKSKEGVLGGDLEAANEDPCPS